MRNELRKTSAARIADELRIDILSSKLASGAPLRQDAVAMSFGVSHIPVREALKILAEQGLVTIEPHRGARVATYTAELIFSTLETRALLEVHALRLSAPKLTAADIDEAEAIVDAIGRSPKRKNWADRNAQFHRLLYGRCENSVTLRCIAALNEQPWSSAISREITRSIETSNEEHRKLLGLLRARRVDDACELLRTHIVASRETVERALDRLSK
jgi:DNA-binding GntR family transcriptional regulator